MATMVSRNCEECGKKFEASKYEVEKRGRGRFCSCTCSTNAIKKVGKDSSSWKGGVYITAQGYLKESIGNKKYRPQHDLIMERFLGRPLEKEECVHHIDGVRHNNEISNLELMTNEDHGRLHQLGKKDASKWTTKVCLTCGTTFDVRFNALKYREHNFCSMACRKEYTIKKAQEKKTQETVKRSHKKKKPQEKNNTNTSSLFDD
jgi:hypothetical protein